MRAWTRWHELDPEQFRQMPVPPMSCEEWQRRNNVEGEGQDAREESSMEDGVEECGSGPSGRRGGAASTRKRGVS